jgi:hypothetical protein
MAGVNGTRDASFDSSRNNKEYYAFHNRARQQKWRGFLKKTHVSPSTTPKKRKSGSLPINA